MRINIVLLSLVTLGAGVDSALAYCMEPDAPYCATSYGSFDDEYEFNSCKSEMESYQSDVEEHIECNNREAQVAIDDAVSKAKRDNDTAISEYQDAVESFNQRASR